MRKIDRGSSADTGRRSAGAYRSPLVLGILCSLWVCAAMRAQGLMGLGPLGLDANVSVVSIDPVTGKATRLLSTPAIILVQAPIGFDPLTRRLFFESHVGLGAELWTADLARGTVSHVPIDCCSSLQWDTSANVLLGLGFLGDEKKASVFSIDPATGDTTRILSTPATHVTQHPIGFDPATRRLFFEDEFELYTVDLAHGTVSHVPFSCCPSLQWDTRRNELLGLGRLGTEILVSVSTIDPVTGHAARILSTTDSIWFGLVGFDPSSRLLYFAGEGFHLYTADLAHGSVSHVPLDCCPSLFFSGSLPAASIPLLDPIGLFVLIASLCFVGWRLIHGRSA